MDVDGCCGNRSQNVQNYFGIIESNQKKQISINIRQHAAIASNKTWRVKLSSHVLFREKMEKETCSGAACKVNQHFWMLETWYAAKAFGQIKIIWQLTLRENKNAENTLWSQLKEFQPQHLKTMKSSSYKPVRSTLTEFFLSLVSAYRVYQHLHESFCKFLTTSRS